MSIIDSWYCPQCGSHNIVGGIVTECWQCSTPRPGISAVAYRTPACDKHLDRTDDPECPWCKLETLETELAELKQEVARLRFELDRLGAVEDELRHSVSVISSVRSWLMENERGSTHWENCEREHATCRAISQLGDVVERLSRLNLTAGVVERTVTNEETQ